MGETWVVEGFGPAQIDAIVALADVMSDGDDVVIIVDSSAGGWMVATDGPKALRATALDWGNLARRLADVRGPGSRSAVSASRRITRELTQRWTLIGLLGMPLEMVVELRDFHGEESCPACRAAAMARANSCICGASFEVTTS